MSNPSTPHQATQKPCPPYARKNSRGEFQTLSEHLRNVASLSSSLLPEGFSALGKLAGLLHDGGKLRTEFQNKLRGKAFIKENSYHSAPGAALAMEIILDRLDRDLFKKGFSEKYLNEYKILVPNLLASCILAHHNKTGLYDNLSVGKDSPFLTKVDECKNCVEKELDKGFFDNLIDDELIFEACREIEVFLTSLESRFKKGKSTTPPAFHVGLLAKVLYSALVFSDRSDARSFEGGNSYIPPPCEEDKQKWGNISAKLEEFINQLPKTPSKGNPEIEIKKWREKLSKDAKAKGATLEKGKIVTLTLPTGSGKTLSSLRFAVQHALKQGMERVFYFIPFLSIIDQNALVAKNAIGEEYVLEHHSNVETEPAEKNDDEVQGFFSAPILWNSHPVVMTTMVQFFNAWFSGSKSSMMRLSSLKNSVLIFDEPQSIPFKFYVMFAHILTFLTRFMGCTVVLCTATQPGFDDLPEDYKDSNIDCDDSIICSSDEEKAARVFSRTQVKYLQESPSESDKWTLSEIADKGIELAEKHGSSLVICNTTREAREVWQKASNEVLTKENPFSVFHLSARMCQKHRKAALCIIRRELRELNENKRIMVVSTQVIEAGVDISFASGIRLLAGIDAIIQAVGRINRHGEKPEKGFLYVLEADGEGFFTEKKGGKEGPLHDIGIGKKAARHTLRKFKGDNGVVDLGAEALKEFTKERMESLKEKLEYKIENGPPDTMYGILSLNNQVMAKGSTGERLRHYTRQAHETAVENYSAFDNIDTVAVIIPYDKEAEKLIRDIESGKEENIRPLAPYTVNLPSKKLEKLKNSGIIEKIPLQKDDNFIWAIKDSSKDRRYASFYSENYGLDC